MSGSRQPRQVSFDAALAGTGRPEQHRPPPSRQGLMHPTALPLGLALGCCLGVITALIAFS